MAPIFIPDCDHKEFHSLLYQLFHTQLGTLDTDAAATWLRVNRSTLYRWLSGQQRIPFTACGLIWLIASGTLPIASRWYGWRFTTRWDVPSKDYIQRLVTPTGDEYSPEEILSWRFRSQYIELLTQHARTNQNNSKPQDELTKRQAEA